MNVNERSKQRQEYIPLTPKRIQLGRGGIVINRHRDGINCLQDEVGLGQIRHAATTPKADIHVILNDDTRLSSKDVTTIERSCNLYQRGLWRVQTDRIGKKCFVDRNWTKTKPKNLNINALLIETEWALNPKWFYEERERGSIKIGRFCTNGGQPVNLRFYYKTYLQKQQKLSHFMGLQKGSWMGNYHSLDRYNKILANSIVLVRIWAPKIAELDEFWIGPCICGDLQPMASDQ